MGDVDDEGIDHIHDGVMDDIEKNGKMEQVDSSLMDVGNGLNDVGLNDVGLNVGSGLGNGLDVCKKNTFDDGSLLLNHSDFVSFLEANNIRKEWYEKQVVASVDIDRHIRVNPKVFERDDFQLEEFEKKLSKEYGRISPIEFVNSSKFYGIPSNAKLKGSETYENGDIYGMDVASGFAVEVLDVKPGMKVLDLCCAPGAKFCMIADLMNREGELIGVDANPNRAGTCASLCKKYKVALPKCKEKPWYCALVLNDGVEYKNPWESKSVVWDSDAAVMIEKGNNDNSNGASRKRLSKYMKKELTQVREQKRQKLVSGNNQPTSSFVEMYYDRVIVDAECTHDGSIKHMTKYTEEKEFKERFLDSDNCKYSNKSDSLQELQRGLIENGFKLLKKGGILVYSTCSFCKSQNEEIVTWLMNKYPSQLEVIDLNNNSDSFFVQSNVLKGTIQFIPSISKTSGLFVAKLVKL